MGELINQILHERYRIESLLGRRTGRRTFLASDLHTHSLVVIKLLLFGPDFIWDDLKLFEREAETLKTLEHPAIPHYLDSFEVDTQLGKGFALVQSYIEARTLQDWIQAGRDFSEKDIRAIAKELLEILDYLHTKQPPVIHRDIKPSNILLSDRSGNSPGKVYLIDFGSVQTVAHGGTITVVGTYGYMPPEQFGGKTTPTSDLYSLGATLIYLLTKTHPADLPNRRGCIQFEGKRIGEQFRTWLKWLVQPDLDQRLKSAQLALDALQSDLLTLESFPNIHSKPRNSRVVLTKTDDRLQIVIPPLRVAQKLQVIHSVLLSTVWCCIPLVLAFWKLEALLFVAPFVLCIVSPIWVRSIYKIFEKLQLSITQTEISLTHNWLGIKKKYSSRTQDIIKLERLSHKEHSNGIKNTSELKFLYSALNIWAGNQCYSLEKANTIRGIRRLTEVELDWLAFELSDWLDLPVQRFGEAASQINQGQASTKVTNTDFSSTDDASKEALANNLNSVSEVSKISRPTNALCTINKKTEEIEIYAPAEGGLSSSTLEFSLLFSFPMFLYGCLILTINPVLAMYIGVITFAVPVICNSIDNSIGSRRRSSTKIILQIDRHNISLWKQSQLEQRECLDKIDRNKIHKLQLAYKAEENNSYHIRICTRYSNNTRKDSLLVGNRTFWLSQIEAEWLAYELSTWLKLPVTEIEHRNRA